MKALLLTRTLRCPSVANPKSVSTVKLMLLLRGVTYAAAKKMVGFVTSTDETGIVLLVLAKVIFSASVSVAVQAL